MESANLTSNQVLFILRSVGTVSLYNVPGKGHYGREEFMTSFMKDMQNSLVGQLAAQMAIKYELDYDFSQNAEGIIILRNQPSVEEIQNNVANIGMWIPYAFRGSPEHALTYFERYGNLYKGKAFRQAKNPEVNQKY